MQVYEIFYLFDFKNFFCLDFFNLSLEKIIKILTSILIANGFSHNFEEILFRPFFVCKRFAYRCFNSIDIKSLKDSSLSLFGSFIGYIHIGNSDFGSIKVVISQYVDQLISENQNSKHLSFDCDYIDVVYLKAKKTFG